MKALTALLLTLTFAASDLSGDDDDTTPMRNLTGARQDVGVHECVDVQPMSEQDIAGVGNREFIHEFTNNCSFPLYVTGRFSLLLNGRSVGSGKDLEWGQGQPSCAYSNNEMSDSYIYDTIPVNPGEDHRVTTCFQLSRFTGQYEVTSDLASCRERRSARGGCFPFE